MRKECINIHCTFRSQKCGEERSRKDFKISRPCNRSRVLVECKHKIDATKNRGRLNHPKIINKIPENIPGKARHIETAENRRESYWSMHTYFGKY
jgi:hypothetical protein